MTESRPNIILITTDQQRFDTFGPYAPPFLRTPHQNFLAREGVVFDRAYAESPLCVPSRASIMTGQSVFNHGLIGNGRSSDHFGRNDTLPTCLADAGYQTIAIGKMHFEPARVRHGFDEMILPADYYQAMERSGSPMQPMRHGLGQNEFTPGMATVPESMTLTSWIAEQAVDFIHDRRDPTLPFFLWVSFSKPHPPFDPPEPYYSMYRDAQIEPPAVGEWRDDSDLCPTVFSFNQWRSGADTLSDEIWREVKSAYYGLVTQVDYAMGRVFSALLDEELMDESVIMYTSDHGEYLGDHRAAQKGFFHDSSARVPFILRLPKSWPTRHGDSTTSLPISHSDILPTLVNAAGGVVPSDVDGMDLIAFLDSESSPPRRLIFGISVATFHNENEPDFIGVTDGHLKYIWYPEGPFEQFFDLDVDPRELNDLATSKDYVDRRDQLRAELISHLVEVAPQYVTNGELLSVVGRDRTPAEARSAGWPGFHTEKTRTDTQH